MSDDEAPPTKDNAAGNDHDAYTDDTLGMSGGYHGLALSSKQLPHKDEAVHRDHLWVGIPWRWILITCAGIIVALLVFGLLSTLVYHLVR